VNYSDQVTLTANVTADNSNAMSELLANAGTVTFKVLDQSGTITTLGQAIVASNGTATGSYVVTLAPGTYDILVDISSASVNVASVTNQSTNRVLTVNPGLLQSRIQLFCNSMQRLILIQAMVYSR
jgi:hypothetical protein